MRQKIYIKITVLAASLLLFGCVPVAKYTNAGSAVSTGSDKASPPPPSGRVTSTFRGLASYYHDKFDGRTTASGETFNQRLLTAAHRTLPFGTLVRVTNTANNRQTTVRINDRGPFVQGRIIDLSRAAAAEIGMLQAGVVEVIVEVIEH